MRCVSVWPMPASLWTEAGPLIAVPPAEIALASPPVPAPPAAVCVDVGEPAPPVAVLVLPAPPADASPPRPTSWPIASALALLPFTLPASAESPPADEIASPLLVAAPPVDGPLPAAPTSCHPPYW